MTEDHDSQWPLFNQGQPKQHSSGQSQETPARCGDSAPDESDGMRLDETPPDVSRDPVVDHADAGSMATESDLDEGDHRDPDDEETCIEVEPIEEPAASAPGGLKFAFRKEAPGGAVASVTRSRRILGCVLGGAIGDAMGHPTEFLSMQAIHQRFGPRGVTQFELYWSREGRRFAPYTDDTQMAECVLRALLDERDDLDRCMMHMAQRFIEWSRSPQGGHRAPGNACLSGCRALASGAHWSQAGGPTAGGCGSVMRAYPFGLVFADDLEKCETWAVAHSRLTHRDPIALAASAAMAVGVARILRGDSVEMVTSEMVAAACRHSAKTAAMMARAIDEARSGVGPEVTLERLQSWAAHEAIAAAVYLFERHPDDPRAAILAGANTPGDSDSIATLAGSLVGARCGIDAIPQDWVREVERSEDLLALAERIG